MQDLAVVPILFVVGVLGAKVEGSIGVELALALGKAVLTIGAIYLVGRLVLRPVLRLVAQARSPEMFMAAVLLAVVGLASITGLAGLSMPLGAFLAGLLLAETEFRHEIEVDIEPFKGLMLGLFFMSVGMGIDWRVVADEPVWIAVAVVGLFALKSTITAGLCVAFGVPRPVSLETGLLLGQGGEFAFIVVGLAMSLALLPADVGQYMLIVTGLTMLVTPLVAAARRAARRPVGPAARRRRRTRATSTRWRRSTATSSSPASAASAGSSPPPCGPRRSRSWRWTTTRSPSPTSGPADSPCSSATPRGSRCWCAPTSSGRGRWW